MQYFIIYIGHSNQMSLVSPKKIETLKSEKIIQVAASRNNTYFLKWEGVVFSCGSNDFGQLGGQADPTLTSLILRRIIAGKLMGSSAVKQV